MDPIMWYIPIVMEHIVQKLYGMNWAAIECGAFDRSPVKTKITVGGIA